MLLWRTLKDRGKADAIQVYLMLRSLHKINRKLIVDNSQINHKVY